MNAMNKKSNTPPSVSIAIPVFNQAGSIQETVESAIRAAKNFPLVEVVISENHSNDGTEKLLSDYVDHVRIVCPPKHLRMAANWNYVVGNCHGEWIAMLSGDDLIYPNYIPSIRKAIQQSSNAVFAMGGWKVKDQHLLSETSRRVLSLPRVARRGTVTRPLVYGPKASFASFCFRKSAFEKVGGFSEKYHLIQDWILQFDLSLLGDFVKTDKIIAEYKTWQDRSDLENRRLPLYCEDLAHFCLSTVWKAEAVGVDRTVLIDACERHMARAESLLSCIHDPSERVVQSLRPVYELIGKERVGLRSTKTKSPISIIRRLLTRLLRSSIELLTPS
jgi:glycosyltransferase involved in cell wall biosynthesis